MELLVILSAQVVGSALGSGIAIWVWLKWKRRRKGGGL